MNYVYERHFKSDASGYSEYRPGQPERCFYCDIYPGVLNENTGAVEYGQKSVRSRIIPYSVDSVQIAGWEGVFSIFKFNFGFALLDNGIGNGKSRKMALIEISDIRRHFLEIKEI